ncbi:MAG: SUMF1/EgtB/PvdO family nonheme iron enzyme [Chthoniobacterales bacterium]|nr:SUMF1/EgtB/PvdO family nonheme iron enzyme [Chthoniobacterales bacterium]
MKISPYIYCAFLSIALLSSRVAAKPPTNALAPTGTKMMEIGDLNNNADDLGHGTCDHFFKLGAYEWTVRDWKEQVLDQVATQVDPVLRKADPHELWNHGMERWITRQGTETSGYTYALVLEKFSNLPITNVNLFDTLRACNIRHNLKQRGSLSLAEGESFDTLTENGAYTITIDSNKQQKATKEPGALYSIPTQNEWIKAAYYKGGSTNGSYFLYPTQKEGDLNPGDREGPQADNKANYDLYSLWPWAPTLELSEVNYCGGLDNNEKVIGTHSYYGCFDMAGNVNEWTTTSTTFQGDRPIESESDTITSPKYNEFHLPIGGAYIVRGGDYQTKTTDLLARTALPWIVDANKRSDLIGFRMAETAADPSMTSTGYAEEAYQFNWTKDPLGAWDHLSTGEQEATIVNTLLLGGDVTLGFQAIKATASLLRLGGNLIWDTLCSMGRSMMRGLNSSWRWTTGADKTALENIAKLDQNALLQVTSKKELERMLTTSSDRASTLLGKKQAELEAEIKKLTTEINSLTDKRKSTYGELQQIEAKKVEVDFLAEDIEEMNKYPNCSIDGRKRRLHGTKAKYLFLKFKGLESLE